MRSSDVAIVDIVQEMLKMAELWHETSHDSSKTELFIFYADDTQLYISFSPLSNEDTHSAMMRLQACVVAIQNWMIVNKLKLNADKTDAILICWQQLTCSIIRSCEFNTYTYHFDYFGTFLCQTNNY